MEGKKKPAATIKSKSPPPTPAKLAAAVEDLYSPKNKMEDTRFIRRASRSRHPQHP